MESGSGVFIGFRSLSMGIVAISCVLLGQDRLLAQNQYGRNVASGTWASGWINESGGTGGVPNGDDSVYIGSGGHPFASARAMATVNLSDARAASSVTLGYQSNDRGTLNIQSGGTLTTDSLNLATSSGRGDLSVAAGGALTVNGTLSAGSTAGGVATINLTGQTIQLNHYDQGGPVIINRGAGGGFNGSSYHIRAGSFEFQASDNFLDSGNVSNATVSNSFAHSLTGGLSVNTGALFNANASVTLGGSLSVQSGAVLNANAAVSAASSLSIDNGGVLNLNNGLLTTASLNVNSGGRLNQSGGDYSAGSVSLSNRSSLTYHTADNIDDSVSLNSGAIFALQKDLSLTSSLGITNATLNLNGNEININDGSLNLTGGAIINRGAGGGLRGSAYTIQDSNFEFQAADNFSGSGSVSGGATVSNSVPHNLTSSLSIYSGAVFNANAALSVESGLQLYDGAELNANANVTVNGLLQIYNGAVLSANTNLSALAGLEVRNNGMVNTVSGTTVNNSLAIGAAGGASTLVVSQSPSSGTGLSLEQESSTLNIGPDATINLVFDSQQAAGELDWAFRWEGEHIAQLQALLGTRIVASGAPQSVSVIYDPTEDFTYIGYVTGAGDYNDDNVVNAADYVVWRKFVGTTTSLPNDPVGEPIGIEQYNNWRANFGKTSGGSGGSATVPEPFCWQIILISALSVASFAHSRHARAGTSLVTVAK